MLWSLSLVLLAGFSLSGLFKRFHLPGLLGMMITGILLGPYLLNLIDESILGISSELRKMALVVILLRAGLSLDLDDLKKVGRPAFLLSFLPALLEIGAITLVAPLLFGFPHLESALLAAILAAVSPA
ncbi:MAG TPA: potassium transporter, partial [Eubacteriaceae bacterium]|nr:potassium transporter [Eubacteriaceae bacterium]